MDRKKKITDIVIISVLISFSVVLSLFDRYISSAIIIAFPIIGTMIPNFKIGLANIVILIILINYGFKIGLLATILKIILVGLFNPSGIPMSLCGSILSFCTMSLLLKLLKKDKYLYFVSSIGGFMHSLGQIIAGFTYYGLLDCNHIIVEREIDLNILIYSPLILIVGLITGLLIGFIVKCTNIYILKTGIIKLKKEGNIMSTIFVGHRGSRANGGVENTKEAFLGGVKAKVQALECDVRVTSDKEFIIFHDNDLTRLTNESNDKYNLDVNKTSYITLKQIELTQSYNNNKYSGYICRFEEYLDICQKNKMIPIIELKWTNGIYSNNLNEEDYNYSNLDCLVDLVKKYNLFQTAYIMTSMRGCLAYLRKKYPTIKLQWLCSTNVLDYIDWAIDNDISIDVEYNSVSKEIVEKCHNKGLVVNIWTLNDEKLLDKYLEIGVDMITSDYITKKAGKH